MSAFVVGKKHIDYLVSAAKLWGPRDGMSWQKGGAWERISHDTDFNEIGKMLWKENGRSVHARYEGKEGTAHRFEVNGYTLAMNLNVTAVQVLKAIQCYEYQSCESDDWESTEAFSFCRALKSAAIHHLPGYEQAAWEVR